jgi:hypothetical protein
VAANLDTEHLIYLAGPPPIGLGPICIALVHNEVNILPQFLRHYRAFGSIQFLMIDDHSTDGSREYLKSQADVSLFTPRSGSNYRDHKQLWRSEPLDLYGDGRWCLVPDVDEHLVWSNAEDRPFSSLISDLEKERVQGLSAIMVDMYCDRPISMHESSGASLIEDFPLFDDPLKDSVAYRMRLPSQSFAAKYPTPTMIVTGGMRDRILKSVQEDESSFHNFLLRDSIRKQHEPRGLALARERLIYLLTWRRRSFAPLNLTKLPLLKWQKGGKFNGGAHHLNLRIALSSERGVLLHFPLTRGEEGARYIAQRGQHYGGAAYYRMLADQQLKNPMYFGTSHYSGTASLSGFFLP